MYYKLSLSDNNLKSREKDYLSSYSQIEMKSSDKVGDDDYILMKIIYNLSIINNFSQMVYENKSLKETDH
jgi:hypothetical protein